MSGNETAVTAMMPDLCDSERCFIGAIMYQNSFAATELATLVIGEDFEDPKARVAVDLAAQLAANGHDPDPQMVVAHAQRSGAVTGDNRVHLLADYLVSCYTGVPFPHNGIHYARSVLDTALRRQVRDAGRRLIHAAEEAGRDELIEAVMREFDGIRRVRDRLSDAEKRTE
ncbi:DnaB-like helicase N-terminal domain-containing protein [Rhodococcus sp. ACPA1]|uniref:DnaB-like helicase N-terminal domain-containing protein n=1 Tax=Rhodococcus sp. ACPA1 TaxID=2028572 RepID=UPI000BB0CF62|nr:DnaB-like helicase N-terminal domain-containing protein [Rhodococcus sp. ACPA1]PBC57037.1 hypothetical protein CJ177_15805 [Rhodococcus sp. ACPA1]